MFLALWARFLLHPICVVSQAGRRYNRALVKQEQMEVCLLPPQGSLGFWLISIPPVWLWFGNHHQLLLHYYYYFFLMWTIFKVFIEFVTILLLFYALFFWPWGMWDPSSPTRDWTCTPCIGRWSLNHGTTREVLKKILKRYEFATLKKYKTLLIEIIHI